MPPGWHTGTKGTDMTVTNKARPKPLPEDTSALGGTARMSRPVNLGEASDGAGHASPIGRDLSRTSIPVQIATIGAKVRKNLNRIAGLTRAGDLERAARVVQMTARLIGTSQALADRLNAMEPGTMPDPIIRPSRTVLTPKRHKRWADDGYGS